MHLFTHRYFSQGVNKSVIPKCSFVPLGNDSLYLPQGITELSIPVLGSHINGIIWCVCTLMCMASFAQHNILRVTYIVACVSNSFFSISEYDSIVGTYHNHQLINVWTVSSFCLLYKTIATFVYKTSFHFSWVTIYKRIS